ncbi:MAG TPA: GGDEF domain-containing protein [Anaerolineaceae bacterium]|nr:GGDEF domain-containing protein [Anaerolineaceae bacterium]
MILANNLMLNIFSILLLTVIYVYSRKHNEKKSLQFQLYRLILLVTAFLLLVDSFSRFDGRPDTVFPLINHTGNFLMFLLNATIPSLWLMYVHYQVYRDEEKTKRLLPYLIAIHAVNAVLVVLSLRFGWFYAIDANNIYHRGPFYLLSAAITVAFLLVALVLLVVNRSKIEKKYYYSLVFFAVPPFVCIVLQILVYGLSLILNGVVLSMLIVCLYIQNQGMNTDYLTGINNRKKLEAHLVEKIDASTDNRTFSVIMLDLDNFKFINDAFGHDVGDQALGTFVKLLRECVRSRDFLARFGGDEFYVVLDDLNNESDLEAAVDRIKSRVEQYNESSAQPYRLGFSAGYAVYDQGSHMNVEQFKKHIDQLMYENKRANQALHDRAFLPDRGAVLQPGNSA